MIFKLIFLTQSSHAFFGVDAGVTEAMKKIEGAAAASIMIDEVRNTVSNGLDVSDVEDLAVKHSEEVARYHGKSTTAARNAERIKNMDSHNSKASEATKALNKTIALYSALCVLSPDSCQTAAQEIGNRKQEATKLEVEKLKNEVMKQNLREQIKEARENTAKKESLKAIENIPSKFFNFLKSKK